MQDSLEQVRVAVIQATPILFDRQATVEKTCQLAADAAAQGAQLLVFPEAFIPAYPRGLGFGTVVGSRSPSGRRTWERYWANGVDVPGPATEALRAAARQAKAYLAVGVVERDTQFSRGTLYCTTLYFGPDGRLLGKHRKLKPTGAERLIWGEGDGHAAGQGGGTDLLGELHAAGAPRLVLCGARMAMYAKGVELYLAPTADAGDTWQATLRHIACEGRCFVLGCNQFVTRADYPRDLLEVEALADQPEVLCRGGSAIVSPLGEYVAGPLFDEEGMLVADLDVGEIARAKFDFDVVGHYGRPDVFQLTINERPAPPVTMSPK
jgi:nitrilase